jgi:nucleoside 2-deoxyribosyltransferase
MENDRTGADWRNQVRSDLADTGIIFFSPYERPFINDIPEDDEARAELSDALSAADFSFVVHRMTQIRAHDLRLVDISDFIIARIDPKVVTYGTIEEITTAVREKKPVFLYVVGGKMKTPLWLLGMFPHKYVYNSLDDLIATVRAIDQQQIFLSSDRWKLLRPEYR